MSDLPWAGKLSCDLRKGTLAVSTEAMVIIDFNGIAWATVLPSAGGFYDHAPFIVKAVNSHDELVKALEKVRSYNVDIIANRINYRPRDHIQVIDEALASIKEPA